MKKALFVLIGIGLLAGIVNAEWPWKVSEIQTVIAQNEKECSNSAWTKIVARNQDSHGIILYNPDANNADFLLTFTTYTHTPVISTSTYQMGLADGAEPMQLGIAPSLTPWCYSMHSAAEYIGYIEY